MDRENKRLGLVFIIPTILFFLFEFVLAKFRINRFYNFIENLLFVAVIILVAYFINNISLKKIYLKLAYVLFCICLFFESIYYYNFETIFSSSAIFVILETNITETKEFLFSYLNKGTISLIILFIIAFVFGLLQINKYNKEIVSFKFKRIKVLGIILFIFLFLKVTTLIVYNVPYLVIKTTSNYYKETQLLSVYGKENPLGEFTNVKSTYKSGDKQLYIVVIGESISKLHFQLSNLTYYRETTPLLNDIKDELILCEDVISPHAYTIGALTKGLTLGNIENPEGKYKGSIIQLLNQANFKTFWISNQRPIGISDTQVTKIGRGATISTFLNIKHTSEDTPFDQVLVDELNKIVLEPGEKKVVFLHMIGAHINYEKRYPDSFNYFKDVPKSTFKNKIAYETINAYDNVVRYNDYILNEIINVTKKQNTSSFVLFFSDHGQEVYDEIEFFGQSVDQMVTKSMYRIPMFLWQSEAYVKTNSIKNKIDKKYMTDDMIHTIADLCHVNSNEIDSTRSIFNSNFKERKRIIKAKIDFDTDFIDVIK
ncbi:phosphoethanolamine transferase [Thalassobellus sediminis]|uniref:phosphoethanolamine transferase n=1 Tax=Thalassobellus sediminis TaxID=3367753 RepID=UPI0037B7820D